MAEFEDIPLSDLLLDQNNARLTDPVDSQQAAMLALVRQASPLYLLKQAEHIVVHGLDPSTLPIVVPTGDDKKRYVVLEGNRRVLALKALEMPSRVEAALSQSQMRRLLALSRRFEKDPIDTVRCSVLPSTEEATMWVSLRHTGRNGGVGLMEWGSNEKDRFTARHGDRDRSPAGQVIDFVREQGTLSEEARSSRKGVLTNVARLLSTPEAREALGIDLQDGAVVARYPMNEVRKSLTYVVEAFLTGKANVKNVYHAPDRKAFANAIPHEARPNPRTRFGAPIPLTELTSESGTQSIGRAAPASRPRRRKPLGRPRERTTVIPRDCDLDIDTQRVNAIYYELRMTSRSQRLQMRVR